MEEGNLTDAQVAALLRRLGEMRRAEALSDDERAAAYRAVDDALDEITAPTADRWRTRLAALLRTSAEHVRSVGVVSGEGLTRAGSLAAAAVDAPPETWSRTRASEDGRLAGTLLVNDEQEVWVSFESRARELAGRTVAFTVVRPHDLRLERGQVRLRRAGVGVWEGRRALGHREALGLGDDTVLCFALLDEQ